MKNLRRILRTLIVFLITTNAVYAVEEILTEEKFNIKKTAILGAGIFLVIQILFISYKTDKEPEEIYVRKNKNEKRDVSKENKDAIFPFEENLEKAKKEEENLFFAMKIEKEVETFQDDKTNFLPDIKRKLTKIECENKKQATKISGERKKREIKTRVERKKHAEKNILKEEKETSKNSKNKADKK